MKLDPISFQSRLLITLEPVADVDDIEKRWKLLEKYRTSIFLSWSWMKSWLKAVNDLTDVYVLCFYTTKGELAGIAFLSNERVRRRKLFKLIFFSLNETVNSKTKFIIEYNNILHDPAYRDDIYFSFFDLFKNCLVDFDEIKLNAIDLDNIPDIKVLAKNNNFKYLCEKTSDAHYVNLNNFKNEPDRYIASLSKNKREQIRRSIKYFQQFGDENLEIASNTQQALLFFQELGILHQIYWTQKGHPGSFSNKYWVAFHEYLISNFFEKIRIVKLSYGEHVVGFLYNFIDCDSEYSIQSGFNYTNHKNNRPGLVLHYLAIRQAISDNLFRYDFLVGESQYKESLSNMHNTCAWIQIQNNTSPILYENIAIRFTRFIKLVIAVTKRRFNMPPH